MLDEIVSEFLVESYESLDQLDQDLMALEETPDDRDRLASIFRTIHTIKGTAGFLAFPKLERLAHVGENLLVPLRDGELTLNNDIADALLAMVDGIRSILGHIEQTASEGDNAYEPLIARLESLKNNGGTSHDTSAEIPVEEVVESLTPNDGDAPSESSSSEDSESASNDTPSTSAETDTAASAAPDESAAQSTAGSVPQTPATTPDRASAAVSLSETAGETASGRTSEPKGASVSVAESTVRIDVHLLDRLMNLVGELVLARNQIMRFSQDTEDPGLAGASQRINLITTELQEGVMKTRMQPIRNAWNKLPRVVRDLSHSCGKQVQVRMEGADTELDKTILEAIKDPLTHIVRNSVDHGIEPPEERTAAGKPAEGTLLLRAFHEGGQVNIEIIDDGSGIHVDRVRARAVEKGLVTQEQAAAMSDREAVQLILLPGFSTAAQVTNVSGRGVGMDVVKTNVEKIGGSLDIQTEPGQGTTLRIKIPLTLAIVPALVVTCGGRSYCLPQVSLLELVRLDEQRVASDIEILHSTPVYRLRGRLLPLVYLDEELGLRPPRTDDERRSGDAANVVVLQAEDRQFGLVVDDIRDTQEIVVKPLGQHLKNIPFYAGSTIMGDGTVALILDVIGIARHSSVLSENAGQQMAPSHTDAAESAVDLTTLLLVAPSEDTRAAIPLSMVSRLEEIPPEHIEHCGPQTVVQYRGSVMPLVSLNGRVPDSDSDRPLSVVVFRQNEQTVGIHVGRIVDIVEHGFRCDEQERMEKPQIIAGRITQVIDLKQVAATA